MQQDRLDGWMVKQIENADLAKETVIQLPVPKSSSIASHAKGGSKSAGTTPRKPKAGPDFPRLSITAAAGHEMCLSTPGRALTNRSNTQTKVSTPRTEESIEKSWRAQFINRRQPCVEGDHVDRARVLHNIEDKKQQSDEEQSPLFLWGLPREHILDFIRQSVLPSSWAMNHTPRATGEWKAVPDEDDKVEQVRRVISNVLARAPPPKSPSKSSPPRSPTSPRSPNKKSDIPTNPRRPSVMSPRMSRANVGVLAPPGTANLMSPRTTPRSEDKINHFIAELRTDPNLWAAFQRDVDRIQQQYRIKNNSSDKIRKNKERAKTPQTTEANKQRKKQTEERMERTRCKREQIIYLEEESKREAYLRRMNPGKQLTAAELELTVRYRRRKMWLLVMSFAAISNTWHNQLVQAKQVIMMSKIEVSAACVIQQIWRRWRWRHASKHTVVIYTWLRKCLWKLIMQVRCRRKARQATLLRQFMFDHLTESNATRNFNRVMLQWRAKVIRAQKSGMSFINCTRARMYALSLLWDSVDHERQRMDRDDGRRLTMAMRKDSATNGTGSATSGGAPGSAGARRKGIFRADSIKIMGGVDEKLASMQMLLTPIEVQRLQQNSVQVVKIPKIIKMRLLTQFLIESRKKFARKQQDYRDKMLCASYAREVKLDEARAIVQSSVNWGGAADTNHNIARTRSIIRAVNPPPCFLLFSDPNTTKDMEALVRQGVQLTLDADPELRALVMRQKEHRFQSQIQSQQQSPRRPSVSFSGTALLSFAAQQSSQSSSPSPRNSILKKNLQGSPQSSALPPSLLSPNADKPFTPLSLRPLSGRATTPVTRDTQR